jgi:hypothetical protein
VPTSAYRLSIASLDISALLHDKVDNLYLTGNHQPVSSYWFTLALVNYSIINKPSVDIIYNMFFSFLNQLFNGPYPCIWLLYKFGLKFVDTLRFSTRTYNFCAISSDYSYHFQRGVDTNLVICWIINLLIKITLVQNFCLP